jgi:RNA polymerase sigma-70 factor (ECF subfamily)
MHDTPRLSPDPAWDWSSILRLCQRETRRLLGVGAAADDAAQEAAFRAWRARSSCADPDRPGPWVTVIARHEALRIAGRPRAESLEEIGEAEAPDGALPEADRMAVHAAVKRLSPGDRELLVGRYWLDLTHRELAHRLGIPVGTAKVRLHRLRSDLRTSLSPL